MNETKVQDAPHYDKHTGIDNAINNIDSEIARSESIIQKIKGDNSGVEDGCAPSDPSLQDILDNAEDRIKGKIDDLHSNFNEIEKLLF